MSIETEFKVLARRLREAGYSKEKIISLIRTAEEVPATIFANKISPLKALVTYLHKESDFELKDIAKKINRSYRAVWGAYSDIDVKHQATQYYIPLSIFNNKLSILESVSTHLKDTYGLRISKIAKLLNRKDSTIWTCYNRAIKKKDEE